MNKALVIQTAFLGDAILTLPMIQYFKENNKHVELDVVCIPSTKEVFEKSLHVSEVFVIDKKGKEKNIFSLFRFAKKLVREHYDLVISPHRSMRSSLLSFLVKPKDSVSFDKSAGSFLYKRKIKYNHNEHEVLRNLRLVNFNESNWKLFPSLNYSDGEKQNVNDFLTSYLDKDGLVCAVAPGSVWETKKMPQYLFTKLIEELRKRNCLVVLIGGKDDSKLCEEISSKFDENVISVAGKFNVSETSFLLTKCKFLVTNDSAPTHIGMSANIPVFTVYCSTVPEFGFFPYSEKSLTFGVTDLDCKPCGIHGHKKCPIGTFECGHKINLFQIMDKVEELI